MANMSPSGTASNLLTRRSGRLFPKATICAWLRGTNGSTFGGFFGCRSSRWLTKHPDPAPGPGNYPCPGVC